MTSTVVVADASAVIREGAIGVLSEAGFAVRGAGTFAELELELATAPDIALVDLQLLPPAGTGAAEFAAPEARTRFAVWSFDTEDAAVLDAIARGAYTFMTKDVTAPELVQTIRALERAEAVLSADAANALVRALHVSTRHSRAEHRVMLLTVREREVLRLVSQSLRNREIAQALGISEFTVKRHLQNILQKLGLPSRNAAAAFVRMTQPEFEHAVGWVAH